MVEVDEESHERHGCVYLPYMAADVLGTQGAVASEVIWYWPPYLVLAVFMLPWHMEIKVVPNTCTGIGKFSYYLSCPFSGFGQPGIGNFVAPRKFLVALGNQALWVVRFWCGNQFLCVLLCYPVYGIIIWKIQCLGHFFLWPVFGLNNKVCHPGGHNME